MKQTLTLAICMLLATANCAQEKDRPIPTLDKLSGIQIGEAARWVGCFYPDGSARLSLGTWYISSEAPEGSCSFEEIYNALVPHLKLDEDVMHVILNEWEDEETDLPVFFLADKEVMRKIMHGLCDNVMPWNEWEKKQIEEKLRTYPLIPGDPPYLKEGEHIKSEARDQTPVEEEEVTGDAPKEEAIGDKEEVVSSKEEIVGKEEEVVSVVEEVPAAAKKTGRPSLWFYVGAGVLVCVGAVLFLTRKR